MFDYHQIGKYVLLRELPETPLGRNFRAAELGQTGLDKIVHLSRLINEVTPETKFQHILQSKFDAIKPLIHEGVNHPFEINNIGGMFISQELVEGFSIKAIIRRCVKNNLPFSIDYALYAASRICNTMEYAHNQMVGDQPLIHGGLTPYNIYISFDGQVKIMDWSVVATTDNMATARNIFLQRYQLYLAPEQTEGKPTTPSVDIFQTGLVFYEMLTGSPLYTINRQENVEEMVQELYTMKRVIDGKNIPEEIVNIVSKALSVNPATRYPSIRAMREDLDTLLYSGTYLATTTKTSFFINSIYKDEIARFKDNLSTELTLNYAPYLMSITEGAEEPAGEAAEGEEAASISALPEAGEIAAEDEDIVGDVGDEFRTYTRRKQFPLVLSLIIIAAVILSVVVTVLIVGKEEKPEFRPVVSPEDIARKAELERMRKTVDELRTSIESREQEKTEAEARLRELERQVERETTEQPALQAEDQKIRDALEEERRRKAEEAERIKREEEERQRRERMARLAAELDRRPTGSSSEAGSGSDSTAGTSTATDSSSETTFTDNPEEIPIVSGNDKQLKMEPIERIPPQYPVSLRRAGIRRSGEVKLLVIVATDGTVESARVLSGDAVFHAEAQKAALKWRYTPPTKNGKKVRVSMVVAVNF